MSCWVNQTEPGLFWGERESGESRSEPGGSALQEGHAVHTEPEISKAVGENGTRWSSQETPR